MGVTKCIKCRGFFDEEEIEWVSIDHNHDAPYCIDCSPDREIYDSDDDTYVPDDDNFSGNEDE